MARGDALLKVEQRPAAENPLTLLQYAIDNKVGTAELKEMMAMASEWRALEAARIYGEAIAAFQAECPQIVKERAVPNKDGSERYKFAPLEDIDSEVRPIMARHKISAMGELVTEGDFFKITWRIQVGSHYQDKHFSWPKPDIKELAKAMYCNEVQAGIAAQSYYRRATFTMALNIIVAKEDNDTAAIADILKMTEKQKAELNDLMTQAGIDEKRLLKWIQGSMPEAERSMDKLTQQDFATIVNTYRARQGGQKP